MSQEVWHPTTVDELRVGHFVRIGHGWLDHPFLRNRFEISSDNDLAILRKAGLTRLWIDPTRSKVAVAASPQPQASNTDASDVESAAEQLYQVKSSAAQRVRLERDVLIRTQENYEAAVSQCSNAIQRLLSGDGSCVAHFDSLAQSITASATEHHSPLTFASYAQPTQPLQRRACQSLDAAAIAAVVATRLGLDVGQAAALTQGALLHAVGIEQLPEHLRDESALRDRDEHLEFQHYPLLGLALLRAAGGFAPDVLRIVRQHREQIDGQGFPEGATGDEVDPLACIVGAIREFQVRAHRTDAVAPAAALAHLYRNSRSGYGASAVDNVIAALTVYPPGSYLALSDGSIGRVMRVSDTARMRPLVWLFDEAGDPTDAQIVDLSQTQDVQVARVLDPRALQSDVREYFGGDWGGCALSVPLAAER